MYNSCHTPMQQGAVNLRTMMPPTLCLIRVTHFWNNQRGALTRASLARSARAPHLLVAKDGCRALDVEMALIEIRRAKDVVIIKAYQLIRIFKSFSVVSRRKAPTFKRLRVQGCRHWMLLWTRGAGCCGSALALFSQAFSLALHKHVIMDRLVRW